MQIRETGTVVQATPTTAAVRLRPRRTAACRGCTACRTEGGGDFLLWIEAPGLHEGDRVTVEIPVPGPWRAVGLVFGLPLAALMAGVVAGSRWTALQQATRLGAEAGPVVLGVVLAAAALAVAMAGERRFARRHRPRLLEVHRSA